MLDTACKLGIFVVSSKVSTVTLDGIMIMSIVRKVEIERNKKGHINGHGLCQVL